MQLDVFQRAAAENRSVYIDYPFEDVAVRWQSDGTLYRKFHGEPETGIPMDNNLFHEAIGAGVEITAEEYSAL
jgi:hypothetical protein